MQKKSKILSPLRNFLCARVRVHIQMLELALIFINFHYLVSLVRRLVVFRPTGAHVGRVGAGTQPIGIITFGRISVRGPIRCLNQTQTILN